jgi:hypothetical protein
VRGAGWRVGHPPLRPSRGRSTSRARACRRGSRRDRRRRRAGSSGARSVPGRARRRASRSRSHPRGRVSCRRALPRKRGRRARVRELGGTSTSPCYSSYLETAVLKGERRAQGWFSGRHLERQAPRARTPGGGIRTFEPGRVGRATRCSGRELTRARSRPRRSFQSASSSAAPSAPRSKRSMWVSMHHVGRPSGRQGCAMTRSLPRSASLVARVRGVRRRRSLRSGGRSPTLAAP